MSPSTLAPLQKTIYTGTFISTPTLGSLQVLERHAVGVDEEGVIRFVCEIETGDYGPGLLMDVEEWIEVVGWKMEEVRWVKGGNGGDSWWFPGFVGELEILLFFLALFLRGR